MLAEAVRWGAGWCWRVEEDSHPHTGAPVSTAERCCGLLRKTPDLQTNNPEFCGCVSVWVILGGVGLMETVTRGRWDCVGGFLCTYVSPSLPAWGLGQCLCECSQISIHVGGRYPWLCWWHGQSPGLPWHGSWVSRSLHGTPFWSSSVTLIGAIETSPSAVWVNAPSSSFLGKNNSAISPANEWARSVSCVFEG